MTALRSFLALGVLGVLVLPSPVLAQVYRWVDEQGGVHYSQRLESVPSQYRATATPVGGLSTSPPPAPEKAQGVPPGATGGPPQKPAGEGGKQ